MNKYGSFDEAITGISNKIAFKKLNITDKNREEVFNDQEKIKIFLLETKKNEEDVKNNINAIYNSLIKENPELATEKGLLLDVANYVALQVEEHGITSPEQIRATSGMTTEILKNIVYNNNNYQNEDNSTHEIIQNVAIFQITKEGLENFQKNMQEEYKHNYFQAEDFEQVKKDNEEITAIVGKVNIETLIQKANNGDKESARTLMIVQNAQIDYGYNSNVDKIPEDRLQDYLKDMILLSEYIEIPEIRKIYEKMSEKLPEEYLETNEEGQKTVNPEKLRQVYKVANNGKDIDMAFIKGTYDDLAKQYIQNSECQFKNGVEDFTIENAIEGQKRMLQRNLSVCQEKADKSPEDYKYAMHELRENSKKYLDASLRLSEEMSLAGIEKSDLEIFKNLTEAVVDGLIEAKEGTKFIDDEYTKASKKNLFKAVINNKEVCEPELVEKIASADSEVAREVLKEMLEEYNLTTDKSMGEKIQILNDALKTAGKEEKTIIEETKKDEYDAR